MVPFDKRDMIVMLPAAPVLLKDNQKPDKMYTTHWTSSTMDLVSSLKNTT